MNYKKTDKITKKQLEDLASNKMLLTFLAGLALLLLMTVAKNAGWFRDNLPSAAERFTLGAILGFSLAMIPVALVLYYLARKAGKHPEHRLVNGVNVALCAGVMAVSAVLLRAFNTFGVRMTYIWVVATAMLAVVYFLFRRECFLSVTVIGLSTIVFYLLFKMPNLLLNFPNPWKWIALGYGLLLVLAGTFLVLLFRGKGVLHFGNRKKRFLSERTQYLPIFIALAAVAMIFLAGLLLGNGIYYYGVFASLALLLGYGVYFILLVL